MFMEHIKKLQLAVITILVTFVLLIPNTVLADGPSYDITNYDINAYIREDGSIYINEALTYYFTSSANGLTRDLRYYYKTNKDSMEPNSARYQGTGIEYLTVAVTNSDNIMQNFTNVVSAENGDNGVYNVNTVDNAQSKGYNIKVYSPISSGHYQTVHYSYIIKDAVVQYNDMSEIYYNFIGNGMNVNINNLNLNIYLPTFTNMEEVKYYPHTYACELEKIGITVDNEFKCISFNIKNVPDQKPVDARVVFPNTILMNCTKKYDNNYDFNRLYEIETNMTQGNANYFLHILFNIILGIIILVFAILILAYALSKSKKVRQTIKNVNYYREIPKNLNLLEYQALLPNKRTDALSSNLIIATILDLTNRDILTMETKQLPSKKKKTEYEYYIAFNKNGEFKNLCSYEKQILSLLFSDTVTTEFECINYLDKKIELNSRFKEISRNSKLHKQINNARTKSLIDSKQIYKKVKTNLIKIYLITTAIISLMVISNTLLINPDKTLGVVEFIMFIISIIYETFMMVVILDDLFKIPIEKYFEDQKQILGLWKYLKDYSLIKDRYPIELSIWNEYLVFASLFGIAERVSKEFKDELIKAGYTDDQIYITYPVLCMSSYSTLFVHSINSSTGYSGSGSGGGGGRRWGSRCFLSFPQKSNPLFLI